MSANTQSKDYRPPKFGRSQIRLLERLCNACGVSGNEKEVRAIVEESIKSSASEVKVDALGNVLAIRRGEGKNRPKVMLAAHMDEVGFMLTNADGDGIFRFQIVGGINPQQLAGKPVWVGADKLPGVIGAKPIHLTTREERERSFSLEALRIDIGPENSKKVKVGDWATFATTFTRLGPSIRAKALDDRFGVATLIELVRQAPPNIDLMAAFTVQEEVGLRGAKVAAYTFDPHISIVLDCTPAMDLPVLEEKYVYSPDERVGNSRYNTRLDAGPAIYVADRATLSDPRLIRHMVNTAEALDIPYQFRQPGGGGTDAGAIHMQRAGIPSVSVSVPGRYLHTAASISRVDDWKNSLKLVHAALDRMTMDILASER
jgi:endoglucanase